MTRECSELHPLRDTVSAGLAELNLPVTERQVEQLVEFSELLAGWSRRINLTGHADADSIVRRLVLDSAALLTRLPPLSSLADLGSGSGIPGIPVAILRPEISVVLVESRERRHHFQRQAIRQLALSNARAMAGRIERVDPVPADVAVAQAVAPPGRVLGWMRRWVAAGGYAAIPGSGASFHAESSIGQHAGRVERYRVPLDGPERTLWLVQF